jgi:hypothetical protein
VRPPGRDFAVIQLPDCKGIRVLRFMRVPRNRKPIWDGVAGQGA